MSNINNDYPFEKKVKEIEQYEEELSKGTSLKSHSLVNEQENKNKLKRYSTNDLCINCNTKYIKYTRIGLCANCYMADYNEKRKQLKQSITARSDEINKVCDLDSISGPHISEREKTINKVAKEFKIPKIILSSSSENHFTNSINFVIESLFNHHPDILNKLQKIAEEEIRPLQQQIIFMVKRDIRRNYHALLKEKGND